MNKEELLKQLEEARTQIIKIQSDVEKMQNAVDAIKDKDNNSLPEFWFPTSKFTRKIIEEYGERIKILLNKKYIEVNNDEV